uniref:Uncharacterized protein n=1 Tax=Scleropages formosus TaxID=113540 RepID=A0A8C9SW41_SCLFO
IDLFDFLAVHFLSCFYNTQLSHPYCAAECRIFGKFLIFILQHMLVLFSLIITTI